jgi:hypothetical protein
MYYILLGYSPLENDLVREFIGFRISAFFCQLFRGMDPRSIFIYGGWDLYESDPNVCCRLAIPIVIPKVLVKSTLQSVNDAITA